MKKGSIVVVVFVVAFSMFMLSATVISAYFSSVNIQSSGIISSGITLVQDYSKGYSGQYKSPISVVMNAAPVRGDVLIAVIGTNSAYMSAFCNVSSIIQAGVSWTNQVKSTYVDTSNTVYLNVEIWAGIVGSEASTNVTINLTTGPSFGGVANICEYRGISGELDKTSVNGGSGIHTDTGTTSTTSNANELWIGGIVNYPTSQANSTNGFMVRDGTAQPNLSVSYLEKKVTYVGAANSGTTTSSSGYWTGCMATFLAGTPVLGVGSATNILCGQLSNGSYFSDSGIYAFGNSASDMINTAISQASSTNRGIVTLVNGTWVLTSPIIPQSNVNLTCYSGVTITQNAPSTLDSSISLMLNTNGGINNFVVNGGVWNGNKGSLSDHRTTGTWNSNFYKYFGISIYSSTQSSNITIQNLVVLNVIGQGIDLAGCMNAWVYNCTVVNAGDNPISLDLSTSNSTIEYSTVVGGQDVGINTWGASNCTLRNNAVTNITQFSGASHWGIAAEYSQDINILNNNVSACEDDIISTSNNVLIANNIVDGKNNIGESAGIHILNSNNTIVINNTISNCQYPFATYTNAETFNVQLINNTVFTSGSSFIGAANVTISGGSLNSPTGSNGAICLQSALNVNILNVNFTGINGVTDYGQNSHYVRILNCNFNGTSGTKVDLTSCTQVYLYGNLGVANSGTDPLS